MKIYILLLFLSISLYGYSQKYDEPNFGIILNGNFTTVHVSEENLIGRGMGSFGVFFQKPISPFHSNRYFNRLDYTIEPALSWLSYRSNGNDKRFQSNFIDLSAYLNYIPDRMSDDMRVFIGARPSYLTFTSSSVIDYGNYKQLSSDTQNLNLRGNIDFSGVIGINISMGNVASLEIKYVHSFTNKISENYFNGRPSCLEVGVRLSAIKIKNKLEVDEKTLVSELNKRAQGTLLIMLEAPDEKLIQQLVQEKRVDDADFVRNLQVQTNKNIIREFRTNFDFCKVEFFMNDRAYDINKGNFDKVFLDDNLKIKEGVSLDTSNYFIGSFVEDVSEYTHKLGYGLYLYDTKFIQLGKPYNSGTNSLGIYIGGDPMNYFRRVKTSGYFPEDFRKVIKKVNDRLQLARIPVYH